MFVILFPSASSIKLTIVPYTVTEWVHRGSLNDVFHDRSVVFTNEVILSLARQLAIGLNFLHQKQLVHRDIKPHNCLITDQLNLKIADLGCRYNC